MERAHLVRLERANDRVQHATIMEQDEVLFFPIVRVHRLEKARREQHGTRNEERKGNLKAGRTHIRRDGGALHLVQKIAHFLQVREAGTISVKCAVA